MSEQILLLNRRSKKKRAKRSHNRRRRSNRRRRNNPRPPALARWWAAHPHGTRRRKRKRSRAAAAEPRRRRRSYNRRGRSYRYNSRRRRSHNRRMSFSVLKGGSQGVLKGFVIPATIGAAGAVGFTWLWNQIAPKLTFLPPTFQTGWAGLAVRMATVFGVTALGSRFAPANLRQPIHAAGIGAGTTIMVQGITGLLSGAGVSGLNSYVDYQSYALPGARMSGYMPMHGYMPRAGLSGLGDDMYSPAAVIQPAGTPVPRQFGGLNNYIAWQPHMAGGASGIAGYDWTNDGM